MKIFADFHHGDLYYSLFLLFEKRLGFKIYRPVGIEWFDEGYWKIGDPYPDPRDTAQQYLAFSEDGIKDAARREGFTNRVDDSIKDPEEGVFYFRHEEQGVTHRGITLGQFERMKFDVIVSSIPQHYLPYEELKAKFQPGALHFAHTGNQCWSMPEAQYILSSIDPSLYPPQPGQTVVPCRQEFDVGLFSNDSIAPPKRPKIVSICHYLPRKDLFLRFEKALPEFEFKMYGYGTREGNLKTKVEIACEMLSATFGWMVREPGFGDGYGGHTFLNWVAASKPLIVMTSDNAGLPESPILRPGENCIDLSDGDFDQGVEEIRNSAKASVYKEMCLSMREVFGAEVDFDADAKRVAQVLVSAGFQEIP